MDDKKDIEPTPDHFDSYEAAAEFWDSHDTTDYLDEFRTVEVISKLRSRRFEIEIEENVAKALQAKARQQGVTPGHLTSELLRQQLGLAA
jgi:hypothetical protein